MGRCMVLGGFLNDVLYYLGLGGLVRLDLSIGEGGGPGLMLL